MISQSGLRTVFMRIPHSHSPEVGFRRARVQPTHLHFQQALQVVLAYSKFEADYTGRRRGAETAYTRHGMSWKHAGTWIQTPGQIRMLSNLKIHCGAFRTEMQKKEMLLRYLLSVFQLTV